jgi:glycerol-3-phosphate dehydrogenase
VIIPKTKDGRLIFIIDYMGHPMVGTTDHACDVTHHCKPTQEEIDFIIGELKPYFGEDYNYEVLSAWAGIRPLVKSTGEVQHQSSHNPFIEAFKMTVRGIANFINRKSKGSTA